MPFWKETSKESLKELSALLLKKITKASLPLFVRNSAFLKDVGLTEYMNDFERLERRLINLWLLGSKRIGIWKKKGVWGETLGEYGGKEPKINVHCDDMGHKGSHWIECFKVSHRESIISSCSHPTSKTSVSLAHAQRKALHESSKIFVEHVPLGAWI